MVKKISINEITVSKAIVNKAITINKAKNDADIYDKYMDVGI